MILNLLRDIDERSDSQEKTIIFSQFTSMLDLIEPFLREKGIKYVRCEFTMIGRNAPSTLTYLVTFLRWWFYESQRPRSFSGKNQK